jgi:hypothetical protein
MAKKSAPEPTDEILAKVHPWWRIAYEHGHLNESWFVLKAGTQEHFAWQRYFENLGWFPKIWGAHNVTMPCQWPEWLPDMPKPEQPKPKFNVMRGGKS